MDELTMEFAGPIGGLREPDEVYEERRRVLLGEEAPKRSEWETDEQRWDRLVWTAQELARRVRRKDPADNAAWLLTELDERDRFELLFVQAAGNSPDRLDRSLAWVRQDEDEIVDEVAVELAMRGEKPTLTKLEQLAVMVDMDAQGRQTGEISRCAGVSNRMVQRFRNGELARDVARLAKVRGAR